MNEEYTYLFEVYYDNEEKECNSTMRCGPATSYYVIATSYHEAEDKFYKFREKNHNVVSKIPLSIRLVATDGYDLIV